MSQAKFVAPTFGDGSFTCPLCGTLSQARFYRLSTNINNTVYYLSRGACCSKDILWQKDREISDDGAIIFPDVSGAPHPSPDMPADVKADYEEAASLCQRSPRAAAALLRLAIQKLCKHLGQPGKNINDDIAALVKAGLPADVQIALDVVRVVGNNAVHPGELSVDDVAEIASELFYWVNFIVDNQIGQKRRLQEIKARLPQGALDAIAKRDAPKT